MSVHAVIAMLGTAAIGIARGPDVAIPWIRIVCAFLFCILLAAAAILLLRRRQGAGATITPALSNWLTPQEPQPSQPTLRARLRVSPTSQVVVIQWEDARYLVHTSASGALLLDRRADVDVPA